MADSMKLLPDGVRPTAIEWMFKLNSDPPDQPLTQEKAAEWIDFEVYRQNWHAGRIEPRPENQDHPDVGPHSPTGEHVWPHPEAWIGVRDLDAMTAVSLALSEAGEDPLTYFGGDAPRGSRTSASTPAQPASKGFPRDADLLDVAQSPRNYEEWKSSDAIDRRASTWLGQAIGGVLLCFVYSVPIYLIIAAFAGGITVLPDTREEWFVLGAIMAVAGVPYFSRLIREGAQEL